MRSAYMEFAKTRQAGTYNLAISGMIDYPLAELPVTLADLEINGPNNYGYPPLLEEIGKKCGAPVRNIATTLGTSMANYLAMSAILAPGDEVLIEHPVYELIMAAAGHVGANVRRFPRHPENGFLVDPDDVRRAMTPHTKLIVLTNLHNPSSAYIDETTLRQIGQIGEMAGASILVDEVYLDAMFDDAPKSAFHLGDNFIVTNSLTKIYGLSGIRCGWALAQEEIVSKIWRLVDITYGSMSFPPEQMSVIALKNLDTIKQRSQSILRANHRLLDAFLKDRSDLYLVRPRYGTIVFPRVLRGDVDILSDLLRNEYETTIVPGKYFEMPEHFRLGICGKTEKVEEGLARLGKALDDIAGKGKR